MRFRGARLELAAFIVDSALDTGGRPFVTHAFFAFTIGRTFYASERFFITNALFAFIVGRAFYACFRGFVAHEATRAIGIGHAARGRHDARMGIGHRVALFTHGAIRILIAHALIHGAIAIAATAFVVVGARFAKLLGTRNIATVSGQRIAVVATFVRFEDTIAATRDNACIRIGARVADLARRAIYILVASANVRITQTARARRARCACFAKFNQASDIAAIAGRCIAVVTTFVRFEDAIATTKRHANIRIGDHIANAAVWTIRVLVAGTNVTRRIAETALAIAGGSTASLTKFSQTRGITTVTGGFIAIIAPFADFNDEITATRIHANVGDRHRIADLTARTIRIFGACAGVIGRITETTGARIG